MVDTPPVAVPAAPPASQVLAEQRAGNRDAALSALRQIREGAEPAAAPAAPAAAQVATAPGTEQAPVDPAAAPAVDPEPEPAAPAEATPAAPEPAPVVPPAEPPGMAAVRKQEQHLRKQLAQERAQMQAEFQAQQREWQVKLEAAAAREAKLASARQDPIAALQALGFTEADFDPVGRLIYAASPSGKKDPAAAAAAAQELARSGQNREVLSTIDSLKKEIAELRQTHQQTIAQQQAQANLDRYMASVTKAVGDSTPLARSAMAKNPERTRRTLEQIADELFMSSGPSDELRDVPTPAEVLQAYEARRAAELEELGIDPRLIGRAAPAAPVAAAPPVAPAPRPAATIAPSGVAAPTVPKTPGPPSREDVLAGLQKLRTVG